MKARARRGRNLRAAPERRGELEPRTLREAEAVRVLARALLEAASPDNPNRDTLACRSSRALLRVLRRRLGI